MFYLENQEYARDKCSDSVLFCRAQNISLYMYSITTFASSNSHSL